MSALLTASMAVAAAAGLALLAWLVTLPGWRQRLYVSAALALLVWWLVPLAVETGWRDLERWLARDDHARGLAALATLDSMAMLWLRSRQLWQSGGERWHRLATWWPPLTAPLAAFAFCAAVVQAIEGLAFDTLRVALAAASAPLLLGATAALTFAVPDRFARLELVLLGAVLLLLAGAVLAIAAAPQREGGTAAVDFGALAGILTAAVLVAVAGYVRAGRKRRQ